MFAGLVVLVMIVLVIIIFVFVSIFSPVRIRAQYRYEQGVLIWKVAIHILGIHFVHYEGSSRSGEGEQYIALLISKSFFDADFQPFFKTIKQWKSKYKTIIHLIPPKMKLGKLYWQTDFGTGEACSTGIVAGAIWGIKGSVGAFMQEKCIIKKIPQIMVTPHFQASGLRSEFDCIASLKLGNAIRIRKKYKQILQKQA